MHDILLSTLIAIIRNEYEDAHRVIQRTPNIEQYIDGFRHINDNHSNDLVGYALLNNNVFANSNYNIFLIKYTTCDEPTKWYQITQAIKDDNQCYTTAIDVTMTIEEIAQ